MAAMGNQQKFLHEYGITSALFNPIPSGRPSSVAQAVKPFSLHIWNAYTDFDIDLCNIFCSNRRNIREN